jgi:hypothetical protein
MGPLSLWLQDVADWIVGPTGFFGVRPWEAAIAGDTRLKPVWAFRRFTEMICLWPTWMVKVFAPVATIWYGPEYRASKDFCWPPTRTYTFSA